jgi:hypothetical protein
MDSMIAHARILAHRDGEEPFEIEVQVGTPYQDRPDEWACPVAVSPLYDRLRDARGDSSLQALCLAASLALNLLQGFKDKGGSLFLVSGEEFPLEAYSFWSGKWSGAA